MWRVPCTVSVEVEIRWFCLFNYRRKNSKNGGGTMGCNWCPVEICPLGCRYTRLIAQAGSPRKRHLKMFPTGSPCSASLSAGSDGQPKWVKHNTIPSSLKAVNPNTNSWPLWYENKYAEGDRKGNHQHPSFMFSINGNVQNLSSLLETDEWLIPFAAATFTAAASIRNNTKKIHLN